MKTIKKWYVAMAVLVAATIGRANVVASWDFNGGTVGGDIVSADDPLSGLSAIPHWGDPKYAAGNGGDTAADLDGAVGVLKVVDPTHILGGGFTSLSISMDVNLNTDTEGILVRNGHDTVPFNIFMTTGYILHAGFMDATTGNNSFIETAGTALSTSAGWQTVTIQWDGSAASILVDGVAQTLTGGGTSEIIATTSLINSDNVLGIGAIIRNSGSTGQFLDGAIDNLVIADSVIPEPAAFTLIGFVAAGAMMIRRIIG